jgi:hypothetical protein
MALQYQVPGVYYEPQPVRPETIPVRTDVAGFIGFEPRVRDGTTESALLGAPTPSGHSFQVNVTGFQLFLGGLRAQVPTTSNFILSQSNATIPLADGESIVYALVAALPMAGITARLVAVGGVAASYGLSTAPTDDDIRATLLTVFAGNLRPFTRIANIEVRRETNAIFLTTLPTLSATRCDDWNDFLLAFGTPLDDGTLLAPAVRAYFANGGRRCWIATVRRPRFEDATELERARQDMVGLAGSSETTATGLARLLLIPEVTFADVPDLYASRVDTATLVKAMPPPADESCFRPCKSIIQPIIVTAVRRDPAWVPLFQSAPLYNGANISNPVFETQRALIDLAHDERWHLLLLLSVPLVPDPATGRYVPPTAFDADGWRHQFDIAIKGGTLASADSADGADLYWPWLLNQELVGGEVTNLPPSVYVAGILSRRALARGPQFSPANETLKQVVATSVDVDDAANAVLYSPDLDPGGLMVCAVNVVRAFPGYGIQIWGARTLSTEPWLQYLSVRRTLTAIELRMKAALDQLVFEPNTPTLWMHITHVALGVLLPIYESGALRGSRPEEAFYIRCDSSVNSAETIDQGQLFIDVGVAIAAPAEFIVFRVGRREGVIQVVE